jgi:glycerol-3-phosphate acyltransferase PlsY
LGVDWRAALAFCAVWLGVALATRYSSLSALIAALATPVGLLITGDIATGLLAGLMSALLIFKHRANIRRLTAGEEPRIGAKA